MLDRVSVQIVIISFFFTGITVVTKKVGKLLVIFQLQMVQRTSCIVLFSAINVVLITGIARKGHNILPVFIYLFIYHTS